VERTGGDHEKWRIMKEYRNICQVRRGAEATYFEKEEGRDESKGQLGTEKHRSSDGQIESRQEKEDFIKIGL